MTDESANPGGPATGAANAPGLPAPGLPEVADRATFQAELDRLRVREKAHTREGDAIAAARRRLPMVEVDASLALTGPDGPLTLLDAFEGRRQLIAYYFMWWPGHPAAEQCEGCTWVTTQVSDLSYLHSRDITYAVFCQGRNVSSGWADVPGVVRRERPLPRLHGLGDAVVLSTALSRRAPGRPRNRPVPPRVLPAGWRPRLRNLLDQTPRRRGHGLQLRAHGPHRVRPPGTVGGLAPRLAATMLQHADRRRPARLATSGSVAGRAPHRPVAAPGRRTLQRPRHPALIVRAPASWRPARCARHPETGAWPIRFPSATRRSCDRIRSRWPDVPAAR